MAAGGAIRLNRGDEGHINWGRESANTQLNDRIENATNKRVMRELFALHEIPMPRLLTAEQTLECVAGWQLAGYTDVLIVGRPDRHTKRRGFWRISSPEDLVKARQGTRTKMAATHFMEWIDARYEYRVHVFRRRSIRISEKDFTRPRGDEPFTMIKPTGDVSRVRTAAWHAVDILGLDFGSVDVLATRDGTPYVLEVNTAAGLGGSMPTLWAETFLRWGREYGIA
jgi:hypothetical protein